MTRDFENLRRSPLIIAGALAAIDIAVVRLLLDVGTSLPYSQLAGVATAAALCGVLRPNASDKNAIAWLAAFALPIVFLRGGALTLLVERAGWTPTAAMLLVAPASIAAVLAAGRIDFAARDRADWRTFVIVLAVVSLTMRSLYAGLVQLMPEEAYYWNYAQHLDYGYLDHPPMVAWLIWGATRVFGTTEFAVRVGSIGCGLITTCYVYRLTRNVYGEEAGLASVALTQTLPFFFTSGFLMTPDAPLTAAWAACSYYLERALVGRQANAWWRAGLALGLGLISKYTVSLLAISAAAYVIFDSHARRWLLRPQPYWAVLCALLAFTPVLIWNEQHAWASFTFQTWRRLAETPRFAFPNLLGSVLLLLTPTGALALTLTMNSRRSVPAAGRRLLMFAALLPLGVFFAFSLRHQVKLDWTGAPWVAALPLLAAEMAFGGSVAGTVRHWVRRAWRPTLALLMIGYGAGLYYLAVGLPGTGYGTHIEILPVGWRSLADQVIAIARDSRRDTGIEPVIVGMDRYAIASEIAFYGARGLGTAPLTSSAHLFLGIGLMYEIWTPPAALASRTLLLVAFDPNELKGSFVEPRADRFGPVQTLWLTHDGARVRPMFYRFAYGYRPVATR